MWISMLDKRKLKYICVLRIIWQSKFSIDFYKSHLANWVRKRYHAQYYISVFAQVHTCTWCVYTKKMVFAKWLSDKFSIESKRLIIKKLNTKSY